ncbi:MAG TPA: DUF4838 domain-containing protein [Proteobacteria bacterium]|nr:DUF4838 domain-containing protein [Pseudomonadota bacterium]
MPFQIAIWRMMLIAAITISFWMPQEAQAAGVDIFRLKAIVTGPAPSSLEQKAANELNRYLKKIYGGSLPIETRAAIPEGITNVILLGEKAVLMAGAITRAELEKVKWDGYVIKAKDGRIALAGPRDRATLFGVAGFLEHLGARFYGVTEVIPSLPDATIEEFTVIDRPTFEFRRISVPWQLKSSYDDLGDPCRAANPELFTKETGSDLWIDHTAGYLVPKLLYYDTHTEYYAMIGNGERIGKDKFSDHRAPLCLSNRDVARISIERMIAWIEKQPEKRFFTITYGDTDIWCNCAECRKLDTVDGEFVDRNLYWVNQIAREVGKKYPDKIFLTLAYGRSRMPPERIKPEPNVIVLYAPFWGVSTMCRIHPYYICHRSIPAALEMEGWLKAAPDNLGVYDYSIGSQFRLHAYEKNLKFWAKRGYRGFFELGSPKQFRSLENFVKAKLAWNATLDPEILEAEFCNACYGPAGNHVAAFVRLLRLEKGGGRGDHDGESPDYISNALGHLEQAEQAVQGTPFEARFKSDPDLYPRLLEYRKRASQPEGEQLSAHPNEDALDRTKLWLSKPHIARKGLKDDAELTHILAIYTLGTSKEDRAAAQRLQEYIQEIYRVKLPVNPDKTTINKDIRGVIVVGKSASLASGLITEADFSAAGPDGVVVRGLNGRMAIAASRETDINEALNAFLHILGARHGGAAADTDLPHIDRPIIREFSLIDWPPLGPVYNKKWNVGTIE